MPRFMIEVPHEESVSACLRAIEVFLQTGSHFLTNADWGCAENVHKCWFLLDADSREEALMVVPPAYRPVATIIEVSKFNMKQVEEMKKEHRI
ncbi:MAG TPA: hypothetical protein VGB22_04520 [candidate division Zixibacteria bacterium]